MVNYNINISRNVEVEGGVHNLHSYILCDSCMYVHTYQILYTHVHIHDIHTV
jgi:hypothetical protein